MAIINVKLENRDAFIKKYEKKGFKIDKRFSREDIVKSILPITLDLKTKEIGRTGNVTCAAIASQHRMIKSEEEFSKAYEAGFVE